MTPARPAGAHRAPARERLLDAAEELFYAHGIAATGVDALLTRAGVAPATLYAHFSGKDHLVAAYLERRHLRWRAVWDEALVDAGEDPVARLLSVLDALERFRDSSPGRRGCAFLAAAVELDDTEHPAHRWLVADSELLATRLSTLAEEAGVAQPSTLAEQLVLLYDGALAACARRAATDGGSAVVPPSTRALAQAVVARHLP